MNKVLAITILIAGIGIPLVSAAQKVGGGDLSFTPDSAAPVLFSHEKHVAVKNHKCSGCHHHTFQMEKGAYRMDMAKMTKGAFCGRCHNGEIAFDVKDQKNCARCHRKPQ